MKNIFLCLFLFLSIISFSQNNLQKQLVVHNHSSQFKGKLYNNAIVIDSATQTEYLLPSGALYNWTLDSVSSKLVLGLKTDTIVLDSSKIKLLNSTPIQLVTAPPTGYINVISSCICSYTHKTADFTGDSTLAIYYTGLANYAEAGNAIDGSSSKINLFIPTATPLLGSALAILIKSKTSNPVSSTSGGKIKIIITYKLVKA